LCSLSLLCKIYITINKGFYWLAGAIPEASHCPEESVVRVDTAAVCPLYSMKHVVGYGCKSFGFGSFGISVSISMFILFFLVRGHK
jgi:hypothetical protein